MSSPLTHALVTWPEIFRKLALPKADALRSNFPARNLTPTPITWEHLLLECKGLTLEREGVMKAFKGKSSQVLPPEILKNVTTKSSSLYRKR